MSPTQARHLSSLAFLDQKSMYPASCLMREPFVTQQTLLKAAMSVSSLANSLATRAEHL